MNYLSNALLAFLLLPYLSKSSAATPGPRIVVVASETHFQVPRLAEADKENIINALNDPSNANMAQRYNESKCAHFIISQLHGEINQWVVPSA